jgi:hypothetical protein
MMPGGPFSLVQVWQMALTRKRRILIAALVVVGILVCVWASVRGGGFFAYLAQNDRACSFVHRLFKLAGQEHEFDEQIYQAKRNLILNRRVR